MAASKLIHPTREQWLQAAAELLLFDVNRHVDPAQRLVKPPHVSVGFPSVGARSTTRRRIGECWGASASADGRPHVFIHPSVGEDLDEVLGVLLHELIHAVGVTGHRREFRQVALAVGLEGKMTSTVPGASALARFAEMKVDLGSYPHAPLNVDRSEKPRQTTRMRKVWCEGCGYTLRAASKWLSVGLPVCCCGCQMVTEETLGDLPTDGAALRVAGVVS